MSDEDRNKVPDRYWVTKHDGRWYISLQSGTAPHLTSADALAATWAHADRQRAIGRKDAVGQIRKLANSLERDANCVSEAVASTLRQLAINLESTS